MDRARSRLGDAVGAAWASACGWRAWRSRLAGWRLRGVRVERGVRVLGVQGVELGPRSVVHGGAVVAATCLSGGERPWSAARGRVALGRCCVVMPGAVLASYGGEVRLGDQVEVGPHAVLYGHGGLRVGDGTLIAAHVVVVPASHNFRERGGAVRGQGVTCRGIGIGRGVWIGAGARVLDGVRIGDGAVVGAGAVVNRDVPAGAVVAGVPARQVGMRPAGCAVGVSAARLAA